MKIGGKALLDGWHAARTASGVLRGENEPDTLERSPDTDGYSVSPFRDALASYHVHK